MYICFLFFQFNWSINDLDLEGCDIGPKGARYLCEGLQRKPSITDLVILYYNDINYTRQYLIQYCLNNDRFSFGFNVETYS